MSSVPRPPIRHRGLISCCLALVALTAALLVLLGHTVPRAAGLSGAPELVAQTDDAAPASSITLFGSSAQEEAGETWGIAPGSRSAQVVRYSPGGGWTLGAALQNAAGEPLAGFSLDTPEAFRESSPSPLAAQITPGGAGAMLGTAASGGSLRQVVLVREPGGAFKEAPVPEGGEGLAPGESLFGVNAAPVIAALQEAGGNAGALVAPVVPGVEGAVLHWDGSSWHRETIEVPASGSSHFEVLAIGANSPENAWLLGRSEGGEGPLALFRRDTGGATPVWKPVATTPGGEPGAPLGVYGETLDEPARDQAQLLTVTSAGVWLDARLHAARAPATLYFAPEGGSGAGTFTGTWCQIPASSPGATAQATQGCSEHFLPELPTEYSRSFAWPGAGGFGERIVTGGFDGRMLRLGGSTFSSVDTLGSQPGSNGQTLTPGGGFGAAFSAPDNGWLGDPRLPVHITTPAEAAPSLLRPWPVPFRFALTAIAPQPGAPIGGEGSEALVVGDRGEVARYHPGSGWLPETLPGPGGQRQTPRLRAVAWPTPNRAFAVGDSERGAGQMWLWRGETGLWEKDPAMPLNFRGNLLGIAFDPNNSARGYAVGQQGVLLSYGKSWVQEEEQNIPPSARGANFTSIAFAGSEAIAVWRKLAHRGANSYLGGVIVNNGSGWHEEESADSALAGAVPWTVAALTDGGAAFTAEGGGQGAKIYERTAPGQPWQGVTYPGGRTPGQIALFRENGALRVVGTSSEPSTFGSEEEGEPPPGFPPILVNPYPLANDAGRAVLRQTATGWSDQEHELSEARQPPGGYAFWDTPKTPDPVNAVLVDPSGAQGWAVGGIVDNANALLDTSDIYRYPTTVPAKLNASEPEKTRPGYVSLAVGGGAACAAPCATRADTGVGPVVWLHHAISEAEEIRAETSAGTTSLGAFVYTGPGVTTGELAGPREIPVPWQEEEQFFAERTNSSEAFKVCTAASPTDREGNGEGSAGSFETMFFNSGQLAGDKGCAGSGRIGNSFAFEKEGLRVIVLDTGFVQGGHRELADPGLVAWLKGQLGEAGGHAVVVGNADLPAEYAAGRGAARELVGAIESGNAAAYFFDAPEQNVKETLTGAAGSTPAFGSGTLGYVNVIHEQQPGFIGQGGFLVAEVSTTAKTRSGRYEVTVKLIPIVEELAVEGEQGTLLRRSQVASFAGLARRPRAGNREANTAAENEVAPYIAIPDLCRGANCERGIVPEYRFRSNDPQYGQFVKRNLNSSKANAVLYDSHGKPISQEAEGGKDALFCAYNATPPGQPVDVELETGNLRFSLPVTIQGGSVRQPCGTTALKNKPVTQQPTVPAPVPSEAPAAGGAAPTGFNVPLPPAPAPAHAPVPKPAPQLNPFLPQPAAVAFVPAFVPVPLPTPARPTPPSGTSPVTSPVEAAQKEDEEEAAPESVDAAATAYDASEHDSPPAYLLGLVVIAAFAGATSLRGRRRPRRRTRIAPATVNASRAQRRWERERRRGGDWPG